MTFEDTACLLCGSTDRRVVERTGAMMCDDDHGSFTFQRCAQCGLVYLSPRPTAEDVAAFYPSYYLPHRGAEAWGRWSFLTSIGLRAEVGRRVDRMRRFLDGPASVLDLGCGRPDFLFAAHEAFGGPSVGVDFAAPSWQDERFAALDLRDGDPSVLDPSTLGRFDAITMWHYLEHDYAPRRTLERLHAAAHASTHLFVEVPDHGSETRHEQGPHWEGYHTPRHTAVYDRDTLIALLEAAGWEVIDWAPHGSLDAFNLWWMGERERQGLRWDVSLEAEMPSYLMKRALRGLRFARRGRRMGIQTAVARPAR